MSDIKVGDFAVFKLTGEILLIVKANMGAETFKARRSNLAILDVYPAELDPIDRGSVSLPSPKLPVSSSII